MFSPKDSIWDLSLFYIKKDNKFGLLIKCTLLHTNKRGMIMVARGYGNGTQYSRGSGRMNNVSSSKNNMKTQRDTLRRVEKETWDLD